jgi:hypothetical protein
MTSHMTMSRETVTPKKAAEWLKRNTCNRPLSQGTVERYAKAMGEEVWLLNGDCVRFNGDGHLVDGQHRLHACLKSGKPFETYVVKGLPEGSFDTIDQGRKRTIGDVFARQGLKNYAVLAGAIRYLVRYGRGWMTDRGGMRPDEANDALSGNPGMILAVSRAREMTGHKNKLINHSLLAFLIYITGKSDPAKAEKFWIQVIQGEQLGRTMPAYWLRERLIADTRSVAKLNKDAIAGLAIRAWNMFKHGKQCKLLRFDPSRETFPVVE